MSNSLDKIENDKTSGISKLDDRMAETISGGGAILQEGRVIQGRKGFFGVGREPIRTNRRRGFIKKLHPATTGVVFDAPPGQENSTYFVTVFGPNGKKFQTRTPIKPGKRQAIITFGKAAEAIYWQQG